MNVEEKGSRPSSRSCSQLISYKYTLVHQGIKLLGQIPILGFQFELMFCTVDFNIDIHYGTSKDLNQIRF